MNTTTIKTKSKQKGNLLFVKSHRTDNKEITGNYFANILQPFVNKGNKVIRVKANPNTGRLFATLKTIQA